MIQYIEYIIDTYTYEPGIRKLKQIILDIFRDVNLRQFSEEKLIYPFNVDKQLINDILFNKP